MDGIALFSAKPKKAKRATKQPHDGAVAPASVPAVEAALNGDAAAAPQLCNANDRDSQPQQEPESFRQLGLNEWLDRVCASLGMRTPTEVQRGSIPAILAGRNVIGVAHTGSGKTAAFALPILQQLARDPYGVFALVLTPTRCAGRAGLLAGVERGRQKAE